MDNTLRPQLVFKERNKFFHSILNEYYKISKIPVLLNTSFNGHGQPIIYDLNQPFEHLEKGTVDYLVLEKQLKNKIKSKDLIILKEILGQCNKYNYTELSSKKDNKIKNKTIKLLSEINEYV